MGGLRRRSTSSSTSPTTRAGSCSSSRRRVEAGDWARGARTSRTSTWARSARRDVARLLESLDADVAAEPARGNPLHAVELARLGRDARGRARGCRPARAWRGSSGGPAPGARGRCGRRADLLGRRGGGVDRLRTCRSPAGCSTRRRPPSCYAASASRRSLARPSTRSSTRSCARLSTRRRPGAPRRRRRLARPALGGRADHDVLVEYHRAAAVRQMPWNPAELRERVEASIREHDLVEPGGEVACLVSGGADSTCLWHALRALGYRVSAVHVNHGLRGAESDEDAALLPRGARRRGHRRAAGARPRLRCASFATGRRGPRLRATGHTASDQVETVLYRLVARGEPRGIERRRADGVVRPLLAVWRDETEAYCRAEGLDFRVDSSNPDTQRGLIRDEILPLLRRLHPAADATSCCAPRPSAAPAGARGACSLLASRDGSKRIDLGAGLQAVREYDRSGSSTGRGACGAVRWGAVDDRVRAARPARAGWRAGDRLAGRRKKLQDVFVDAKVPRSRARGLAARRPRRRGRRRARDRRGARDRGGAKRERRPSSSAASARS